MSVGEDLLASFSNRSYFVAQIRRMCTSQPSNIAPSIIPELGGVCLGKKNCYRRKEPNRFFFSESFFFSEIQNKLSGA
jgi:hypothetical protein